MNAYEYLIVSSSRIINMIGSDNYNKYWDSFIARVSHSNHIIVNENDANLFLEKLEANPTSGSEWFVSTVGSI